MSDASSLPAASVPLPEERTHLYWVAKLVGALEPHSTCNLSKSEAIYCYSFMCMQDGYDMGGHIRGPEPVSPDLVLCTGHSFKK
jgi:hypothetical protein